MRFEKPGQKSLEEQFGSPEIIEFGEGEQIEVIDVKPEVQKTEIPTVLAPGWTATPETFKDIILNLAAFQRRVISVNAPHGIETSENLKNIPEAELRKVAALMETLEKKGIEKADVVAHSEGGLYTALAAALYPEKFRNLVLVDPAGIIGQDKPRRLVTDFSRDILAQNVRAIKDKASRQPILRLMKESAKAIAKNPVQAVKEILAISNADIRGILEDLKRRGVGISVIHAVDDKAFPMERVQEVVNTDQVDGFYSIKGTHNEILLNHKGCSRLIDEALNALESKNHNKQ